MGRTFEDYFSKLQADMIEICLEYVNDRVDEIYIYCCNENGMLTSDYFYNIDGNILMKNKLNDVSTNNIEYNISTKRQEIILDILIKDIEEIEALCLKYKREIPTEMKLIYNVKQNSLKGEYKYENVWSNHQNKLPHHIAEEWFNEIKLKNNS